MLMFVWGFLAFAGLSLLVNLFDADFREALSRVLLGIVMGPFFALALLFDRFFPKAGRLSPATLRRFNAAHAWSMAYRNKGIIIIRGKKDGPIASGRSRRSEPVRVRAPGDARAREWPYGPNGAT